MFNKITNDILDDLKAVAGKDNVIVDTQILENYAHDETPLYHSMPEVVIKPSTGEEISEIIALAARKLIPITPRGGGTSLSAGAVPLYNGIVLSLERMNRIREIDEHNLMAVVEPGIITGEFGKRLAEHGLFFPPDPVSLDSCTIGGNIAECAGGPRAMKYGVTKHYVTGIKAIFADGTTSLLGGKLLKNVTGYDIIDLIIGSEGTLAIVAEATIRLLTLPTAIVALLIPFKTVAEASRFSIEIIKKGLAPAAIELMEGDVVRMVQKYLCREIPYSDANGHTIVEIDGFDEHYTTNLYEKIGDIALKMGALDILVGKDPRDRERIWEIRKKVGDALKSQTKIIAREDLVVPKNCIPELVHQLKEVVKEYGCSLYAFGHLGDGNIHTDVGIECETSTSAIITYEDRIVELRRRMYQTTIGLGGTITAEHGIGLSKIPFLSMALNQATIKMMAKIKKEFDPKNIFNPGKIFDSSLINSLTNINSKQHDSGIH